ncbi:MAG: energy transducer TonB [Nitrospirae bacterium]|nr:energy transducer TonB [Nitrospirota bacterium]
MYKKIHSKSSLNVHHGLFLSLFIHVLIFLIPVSLIVKKHIQEIELFVTIEDAYERQDQVLKRQVIKKLIVEKKMEPEIVKEIIKPIDIPIPEDKKIEIVEPAKEIVNLKPMVQAESKQIHVEQITPVYGQPETIDTEFGSAEAPSFLHKEMPVYPLLAKKLGKEGKVVLRLTIDERGSLLKVEVVDKAGYGFTESAVNAIKKSTFLPAKKDGKPVSSRVILPIRFTLRRD